MFKQIMLGSLLSIFCGLAMASAISDKLLIDKAKRAIEQRDWSSYAELASRLQSDPLYPYLRYLKIKKQFSLQHTEPARAFIEKNPKSSMATRLKRHWLTALAKQGDWQEFVRVYTPVNNIKLECDYFHALQQTNRADNAAPYLEKRWLTGKSLPDNCTRAFNHWLSHMPTPADADKIIWQRFELALKKYNYGLANYLAKKMGSNKYTEAKAILRLYKQPYLVTKSSYTKNQSAEVLSYGLFRLARRNPNLAIKTWKRLSEQHQFSQAQNKRVFQAIGLKMAFRKNKHSTTWFRKIASSELDPIYQEWLMSAALYHHDWKLVVMAVEGMKPELFEKPKSQYWYARALEKLGQQEKADVIYNKLSKIRSYYGFLACKRIDKKPSVNHQPLEVDEHDIDLVEAMPGYKRAKVFYASGKLHQSRVELYYLMKHEDKKTQYILTKLVAGWGWDSQSLRLSGKALHKEDIKIRFPLKYHKTILKNAKKRDVSPALVYAIIRQESLFTPKIKSHAGAVGLMQLMPQTAKRTSKQYRLDYKGESTLIQPHKNIALGSAHLNRLNKQLDNHPLLVIASYNAGKNAVERWLPKGSRAIPGDIWVETIPYYETRKYLRNVIANHVVYQHRLGFEPDVDNLIRAVR